MKIKENLRVGLSKLSKLITIDSIRLVIEIIGLAAIVYTICLTKTQVEKLTQQFELQRVELFYGVKPTVDLVQATIRPDVGARPDMMAEIILANPEGKMPAKNLRVEWNFKLHRPGARLCPPVGNEFRNNYGPALAAGQRHIERKSLANPGQLAEYAKGTTRLYVYGRAVYMNAWTKHNDPEPREGDDGFTSPPSSLFCRSIGINDHSINIKDASGDTAILLYPCGDKEWPFTDKLTETDSSEEYRKCKEGQ